MSGPGDPSAAQVHAQLAQGLAHHQQGRLSQAKESYQLLLEQQPAHFDALHLLGVVVLQQGDPQRAVALIGQAVGLNPDNAPAHSNLGNALSACGHHDAALESYDRAIRLQPDFAEAHNNRAGVLRTLKRYGEALKSYGKAVEIKPDFAQAHNSRGTVLKALAQYRAAVQSYDRAIELKPGYAEAHFNRGMALCEAGDAAAALDSFDRAIGLGADHALAHNGRGNALSSLKRYPAAVQSYDKAIEREPGLAQGHYNRASALRKMGSLAAALAGFDEAIRLNADFASAHYSKANVLRSLGRYRQALDSYDRAILLEPELPFLFGDRLHTKMLVCEWRNLDSEMSELSARIDRGEQAATPFPVLGLIDSPALQHRAARIFMAARYPAGGLGGAATGAQAARLRIGYYGADFHDHATAYLMAELFEQHDKTRFELYAFSFGPEKDDAMRRRIAAAFDRFIDVRHQGDEDVARLSRQLGIDIAVDLKGFTADNRAGIFRHRAAPVQVNYLGYPGTSGAAHMDYLVADRVLIPEASRTHYAEKIAYLPGSYQPNDSHRKIAGQVFTRQELGLPGTAFVFCCFNSNYKITPATFAAWMRILARVDGSTLWLLECDPAAMGNLRREAANRGVAGGRLVFAPRLPLAEHLARHRAADLFLDTLPCNAHTTASDALWAGLPVLTCAGQSFAARVAASLVHAVGLPDMAVANLAAYEELAVQLALAPGKLDALKARLARNRETADLFNTRLFTRGLEEAYSRMHLRRCAGLPADHILVELPSPGVGDNSQSIQAPRK